MKWQVTVMAFALTAPTFARAQAAEKRSPFLPPEAGPNAPVAENKAIEFRGLIVMGGQQKFNFFEPGKRISTWVGLNERGSSVTVKSYDAREDTVVVDFGGQALTLPLQKAKVSAAPAPGHPAMPIPAAAAPVEPPAVVLNPTPADEAKRLDAVAAEVRRRRLLRQQASPAQGAPQQ